MQRFSSSNFPSAWRALLDSFFSQTAGQNLLSRLKTSIDAGKTVFPPDPFYALRLVNPVDVRVVILGQDPYHELGEATGLAFSVPRERRKLPPSLRNIFKEISREYECAVRDNGDLTEWANEGVLLLNATLTVEEGKANSHAKWGWQDLTDRIVKRVLDEGRPVAFMLWGNFAQSKESWIQENARGPVCILKANHPSPLSALRPPIPFIGCDHFRLANRFLIQNNIPVIHWKSESDGTLF